MYSPAAVSAICSVRHGVANGALRRTAGPLDDGDNTAFRRCPDTRLSHMPA